MNKVSIAPAPVVVNSEQRLTNYVREQIHEAAVFPYFYYGR